MSAAFEPPFSWRATETDAVLKMGLLLVVPALIWISWLLVGARLPPRSFIVSCCYWFAGWLLVVAILVAADAGAMRLIQPEWFTTITTLTSSGQDTRRLKALAGSEGAYALKALLESDQGVAAAVRASGVLWIACFAALRGAFTCAWLLLFWNACRQALSLRWSRAATSLAVFLCLSAIAVAAGVLVQMAPIMIDPGLWLEKWPILRRWVEAL